MRQSVVRSVKWKVLEIRELTRQRRGALFLRIFAKLPPQRFLVQNGFEETFWEKATRNISAEGGPKALTGKLSYLKCFPFVVSNETLMVDCFVSPTSISSKLGIRKSLWKFLHPKS